MIDNRAQFDRNTLAAVKPGMDSTLADINAQMELFLAAPGDNAVAIESARTLMSSLVGVLKMVGLDGVATLCVELDVTLSDLAAQPQQLTVLHRDAIRAALFGITHFLDSLESGASNVALRLFPEYQQLQQLRGLEMSFELDLFYPNLDVQLPQQILRATPQSDAMSRLKILRSQYQQGLMRWLRQDDLPEAIQQMQQALDGAMRCVSQDASRGYWWAASAFLDCMKQDALPPETNSRKLLGRIDQQLRATAEGKRGEERSILNEMLYLIGHCDLAIDSVDSIKEAYSLDDFLPKTTTFPPGEIDQLLSVMHDQLRVAEESWELCTQGDTSAYEKFLKYIDLLVEQSERLDRDILQYLVQQIQLLSQQAKESEKMDAIAIDMAMAMLLLGSGIENYNRLGSGFQEQARILSERMHGAVEQQPEDAKQLNELVELHYQMEQRGDVMGPLANEMLVNLQHVEQGLNAFFGDSLKRDGLVEILRLLDQIQGGLRISSLTHAEQLLTTVQEKVRHFSRGTDSPHSVERYALADALSALENYMQHLTHGQSGDVWRLKDALAEMTKSNQGSAPAAPISEEIPLQEPEMPVVKPVATIPAVESQESEPVVSQPDAPVEPEIEVLVESQQVKEQVEAALSDISFELDAPVELDGALDYKSDAISLNAEPEVTFEIPQEQTPVEQVSESIDFQFDELSQVAEQAESIELEQEPKEQGSEPVEKEAAELVVESLGLQSDEATPDVLSSFTSEAEQVETPAELHQLSEEELELLEIFLEEAQDVLVTISKNINLCKSNNSDHEALVTIRRGFHTLKGSGRMVGLTDLGEVAWSVESAMNAWLQDKKPATERLLKFIDQAVESFVDWVESLSTQGSAIIEADELVAAAKQIESGSEQELSGDSTSIPTPEPTPEPTYEPAPEVATEPVEDEEVSIGEVTMPASLFNIASVEAKQNAEILRHQLEELRTAKPQIVQYDFMRAAHTLSGLNRTMGFEAVVDLSSALEEWLEKHIEKSAPLNADQWAMLEQSIEALDGMVESICALKVPQENSELCGRLKADKDSIDVAMSNADELPAADMPPATDESATAQVVEDTITEKPYEPVVLTVAKPTEESAEAEEIKPQVFDELDDQLLPVFLEEAEDLSPKISECLRAWRKNPQDEEQSQLLKRLLHTMKGSSRMVGAMRIGEISHEMEDQVNALPQQSDDAAYWDTLEGSSDRINALLDELRTGKPAVEVPKPVPSRRATDQPAGVERRADRRATDAVSAGSMLRVRSDVLDRLVNEAGEVSVMRSRMEAEMRVFKEGLHELTSSVLRLRNQLREVEIQAEGQMQARVSLAKDNADEFDPLEFDRFTRLQELTRFMTESVHDVQTIQHSMLKNLDETVAAMLAQGRITRELQQGLMNVRMVSFNSITDRLYRIVRQTGKELNKRANLELLGTGVELDRSVLEKMIAPFEHLLRNAIVHGLEDEQTRSQSGKLPIGEIRLSVRQENNEVVFEFSDDGAGLNFAKLSEKAIANGSLQQGEAATDDQLAQIIFTPGLSTASEVTEVAGRGVGMDVVRSEITALGGRIEVSSVAGQGTKFTIHLPLTLAVTQIFMVRSGDETFAIPSTMVEQVRQVKASEIEVLRREQQVEWQGAQYPLHYLPHLLGHQDVVQEAQTSIPIMLLRSGSLRIALIVDELRGNHEAMVKNIGPQLARMPGIVGATILGNGKVVMILNPTQYMQRIGVPTQQPIKAIIPKPENTTPLIMVVDDSLTVRKITTRMLTRAGYQVMTATDGVDALEKLVDCVPEVMLLDIEMPRMDGFALARELRRDPKTHDMPIIMITSRTADKHREYAMQLGVNTYLGKPYQEDDLLQNIADFVAEHK
ncbi:MAG: Hpt domain-containing protein [Gallionella sp.]